MNKSYVLKEVVLCNTLTLYDGRTEGVQLIKQGVVATVAECCPRETAPDFLCRAPRNANLNCSQVPLESDWTG